MTCAELEILLCDYIDGTLAAGDRALLEAHLHACEACKEFAADAGAAVAFISKSAVIEPPRELVNRVLFQIPGRQQVKSSGLRWLRGKFAPVLQPRFAMGMAMTILSFSMLGQFAGINHQLRPDDLRPDKVWGYLDDRAHRTWERAVKYYDNLRFVYEIQSRLNDWGSASEEERRQVRPAESRPNPASVPNQGRVPQTGKNGQAGEEKRK
ncbi:MAG: anti-sigma factor [Acidobacteria bacterium]|nr:anti-sigma factor [Acidobacteriota bacterium]